jgi:hypothetical protein
MDFIPPSTQLDCPHNDQDVLPLHSLPVARPVLSLPHCTHVFLVDCCMCFIGWRLSKARMSFIFDSFVVQ